MSMEGLPGSESMRAPSVQERAFVDRLSHHTAKLSTPMPDMAASLDHQGNTSSERQAELFNSAHFSDEILEPFRAHGERGPADVSFTRNQLLEMGHDHSYHGTFLGNLRMASTDGAVVENRLVAVKPFMLTEGGSAAQEVAMLQQSLREGLPTVKPLAVIVDRWSDSPRMYVVTEFADELSTLSSENWRGLQGDDVAERLEPAVGTMLRLHEKGLVHGDPQFKNVATDETGNEIIHDLEEGRSIRGLLERVEAEDEVPRELVLLLRHDFFRVRLSMRDYVYPNLPPDQRPRTIEERFMFELSTLFEQYHQALSESNSPYRAALDRAYRKVLEVTRDEINRGHEPPVEGTPHGSRSGTSGHGSVT